MVLPVNKGPMYAFSPNQKNWVGNLVTLFLTDYLYIGDEKKKSSHIPRHYFRVQTGQTWIAA